MISSVTVAETPQDQTGTMFYNPLTLLKYTETIYNYEYDIMKAYLD